MVTELLNKGLTLTQTFEGMGCSFSAIPFDGSEDSISLYKATRGGFLIFLGGQSEAWMFLSELSKSELAIKAAFENE